MKSFNEFSKNHGEKIAGANEQPSRDGVQEKSRENEQGTTAEELTRRVAAAYRGKSGKTMLADILSAAEQGKRNGTLTNEEIDAFFKQFAPMLNAGQRRQLERITERLKGI